MLGRGGTVCTLLAVGVIVGCGAASTNQPLSIAGLRAAVQKRNLDEERGRYASACEAATAELRRAFKAFRNGGCAGFLKLTIASERETCSAIGHSARKSARERPHFAPYDRRLELDTKRLRAACARGVGEPMPAHITIKGNTAYHASTVYAQYEGGRWRFAGRGGRLKNPAAFEADLRRIQTRAVR